MRQHYEILEFSQNMPVHCTMQRIGSLAPHLHDYFEVIFILSGQCRVIADKQLFTLGPEDIIALNAHTPHELNSADCVLISVQFKQVLFEQTLPHPQHPDFLCNSAQQGDNAAFGRIRQIIARLVKNNADRQLGYELRNWSLIYDLMDVMYNNFRVDSTTASETRNYRYAARIAQISSIINAHYTENFTQAQLAEEVHLSAPYLSKFFDQHFGMNFYAYITQLRLNHAVHMLERTDETIEVVAAESGFPNSYSFVQTFKKEHGVLPSVWRRRRRAEAKPAPEALPLIEQHDYMAGLKKYLDTPQMATGTEQVISGSIRCSAATDLQPLRHTWRALMCVGSARDLLYSDVQEMVRRMQREVGFSYVKLKGVFSDELRVYIQDANGAPTYNFAYLDKIFDFLLSVNLRPLLHLGFMPQLLARDPQHCLFNVLVSEPKDNADWSALVTAFVRHLLARYGAAEVRQWMFGVWHQPDTPHFMYGFSSNEAFYAFYQATWQAVKNCDSALQVGTPPTFYIARADYVNWYRPFLQWCRERRCMPDFLDFNFYDTSLSDNGSGQKLFGFVQSMTLCENPNGLNNFITQVRSETNALRLPVYLTEWNTSPSQQDLLNDTCFKSCYIVKNILENYDKLQSFGYWALTDLMSEAPLPEQLFFGGLGLFTANGIPKASYYALVLLRSLGNTLIGSGDGWFATRQGGSYQVILYNYRHFSHLYAQGERFDMTFLDRYTVFSPEQNLDVHFTLTDVNNGDYLVREIILNRRSGSAFDQWLAMGGLELDSPQEYENLTARSRPARSKYRVTSRRHTLEMDAMLEMLEVRLMLIEPA